MLTLARDVGRVVEQKGIAAPVPDPKVTTAALESTSEVGFRHKS
jgi:hypothetical protein